MTSFAISEARLALGGRKITAPLIENPNKTCQRNPRPSLRSTLTEPPTIEYINPSTRKYDGLPDVSYPLHDKTMTGTNSGASVWMA